MYGRNQYSEPTNFRHDDSLPASSVPASVSSQSVKPAVIEPFKVCMNGLLLTIPSPEREAVLPRKNYDKEEAFGVWRLASGVLASCLASP